MQWACGSGHVFLSSINNIQTGNWCKTCANEARKQAMLTKFQKIAKDRGGECVSQSYVSTSKKLTFRCAKGHCWQVAPFSVLQGCWCPHCADDAKRSGLTKYQLIARKKGGACLSKTYQNASTPLTFRCHLGHEWQAAPSNIAKGAWCPHCWQLRNCKTKKSDITTF